MLMKRALILISPALLIGCGAADDGTLDPGTTPPTTKPEPAAPKAEPPAPGGSDHLNLGRPLAYTPSALSIRTGANRLLNRPAPELRVTSWIKGDRPTPTIFGAKGKVVVLYSFQSW